YGENGAGIPCYWSHQMSDPMMNIGHTVSAYEDEHGLKVDVQLDLDNPNGAYTHKLIQEGRVSQMSFAFDIEDFAFAQSEELDEENGAGIPCYWSHQMSDPMMNIGHTVSAYEDEHGLKVDVQLDLDNPNGAYTHKLIQEGRVSQMSFAFDIEDFAFAQSEELG